MFERNYPVAYHQPVVNYFPQISLEDAMSVGSEISSSQNSPDGNPNVFDSTMEEFHKIVAGNDHDKFIFPN